VWEADLAEVLGAAAHGGPALLAEVFGPSTLLLRYADVAQVSAFASAMEGQLTATIHGEPDELERHGALAAALARRVGRLIFNQFPTGVEVTDAMVHGGPYPATSDGRGTSVGGRALLRFTRLLAYQNAPQALLPAALRDR
jgi:NADP-dependent aldehyde dehydrogenase